MAYAFEGKLLKMRVESDQEIVEHPGSVAMVAIDGQGGVLMLRQRRPAVGDQALLEIPAGTLDRAGEAPEAAARRELKEECDAEAESMTPLGAVYPSPGYTSERMHLFLARGVTGGGQCVRVPLQEAFQMAVAGEIEDLKTVAGVLLARGRMEAEG